jgi:hypothetical protein
MLTAFTVESGGAAGNQSGYRIVKEGAECREDPRLLLVIAREFKTGIGASDAFGDRHADDLIGEEVDGVILDTRVFLPVEEFIFEQDGPEQERCNIGVSLVLPYLLPYAA